MPCIVGVGRSGTTLLRMMLDAHPNLAIPPEFNWLETIIGDLKNESPDPTAIGEKVLASQSWPDLDLSGVWLQDLLARSDLTRPGSFLREIYAIYAERFGKTRFGDKTPKNLLRMDWLQSILPEARFIHIIRDGRDVALSRKKTFMGEKASIETLITMWMEQIQLARHTAPRLSHYLEIRFEELISNTEATLRKVCAFIDLEMVPAQLDYYKGTAQRLSELVDMQHHRKVSRLERRAMFSLTTKPPMRGRIGAWKMELSQEKLRNVEKIARPLLEDLGYEVSASI